MPARVGQECLECKIVARPSANEVVVPNVFPSFVIILLVGVMNIVKHNHRADTLDILEAGFYIVISTKNR